MKTYVYPAIIYHDNGEFYLSMPDLNIHSVGSSEEESFINGKESIKSYFDLAERFGTTIPAPSPFSVIAKKYSKYKVVMIDITVKVNNPELTQEEQDYKNFMKMFFDEA